MGRIDLGYDTLLFLAESTLWRGHIATGTDNNCDLVWWWVPLLGSLALQLLDSILVEGAIHGLIVSLGCVDHVGGCHGAFLLEDKGLCLHHVVLDCWGLTLAVILC